MHKQYNMVYILCIKQAIAWLSAPVAGQYGSKTFSEPGPCTVCTEHTHSWQRLVHVWNWSLFFLVLALSKSAIVEIFSNTLCKSLIFEVCPMYLDILNNLQHTRVAEVTRRPEWPSPKSLDSDKNFKP